MHRGLIVLILIFVALSVGVFLGVTQEHTEFSLGSFTFEELQQEEQELDSKTTIRFVGDIMLARNVERLMNVYGASYPLSGMPPLATSTYLVGNFEGSVPKTHVPTQSMQFAFSIQEQYLEVLKDYGFTFLSLANNHSYDFGADDYAHTKEVLTTNFSPFGDQRGLTNESVVFIPLASSTVAVVGVYAVDTPPALEEVVRVMEYANQGSEFQIAYVHFGTEYELTHSTFQQDLSELLIEAGFDAVVGHHPHVVQDIQLYKGAPIFYSLGNFIFDQYFSEDVQEGLALDLTVEDGNLRFELIPITSIGSRSRPLVAGAFEKSQMLEELAKRSSTSLRESIEKGYVESAF